VSPTHPDILAMLRRGGVLPTYWRRRAKRREGRRETPWHRGFRHGSQIVRAQCGKWSASDGGRVLYSPFEEPWPEPHCRACETATPGTDAVREGLDPNEGVSSARLRRSPA
jgi:hypothetical protein